ncbi:MAG TPA: hypothetical protein VKR23_13935 [Gaiellaceae bacterium]|nr:hypothetical protein [Gaiellaceae bacterium]
MGAAGWVAAGFATSASAGLLPTITVPTLPIPTPTITLPLGTTTVTTTVPQATTAATTGSSPTETAPEPSGTIPAADPPPNGAAQTGTLVAGAVRLANGDISIPISSVTAPTHLVVTEVSLTPRVISVKRSRMVLVLRVRDSRGYLVRGAVLQLTSAPQHALARTSPHTSGATGLARFPLETTTHLPFEPGMTVTIVAQAHGTRTSIGSVVAATLRVRVPVDPPTATHKR